MEPGPDIDAVQRFEKELGDESPRGVVLIGTAILEENLRELMIAVLVPNPSSSDTLFDGPNSAFGSLSSKIDGAYRMGLISNSFCRDLHVIRRIRNEVAHEPQSFRFEDPSARNRIESLSNSHGMYKRSPKWVEKKGVPSLKAQFIESVSWMVFYLASRKEQCLAKNAASPEFGYVFTFDSDGGLPEGFPGT